jgi:hypothetical protein
MKASTSRQVCCITLFLVTAPIFAASPEFTGNISYTLKTVSNPSADQSSAYARIRSVMDSAIWYYNTYTTITKKLTIEYNTSVQTADGNSNGNIRFGSSRTYMVGCTAMHEIAHTVGVGTISQWGKLISNGKYTGTNAINELRKVTADPKAVLNGDNQHFWPYGLNYESEAKSKNDLIYHCLIVNAIQRDFYPNKYPMAILADASGISLDKISMVNISATMFSYHLPITCCFISLAVYTPSGKKIFDVTQGNIMPGNHTIMFNTHTLCQGVYVYRFQAGQLKENNSFIISR